MKLETAFSKALPDCLQNRLSLTFAPAVDDHIIGVSFETQMRECPAHPQVECVMQEQVRQQGRHGSPNAKDNFRCREQWRSAFVGTGRHPRWVKGWSGE
jgi:hypothetical protein